MTQLRRFSMAAGESTTARVLVVLLALVSCFLVAWPLAPQLFGRGKGMDYPLWFSVGRRMLEGAPVYLTTFDGQFDFLYTPFAALLLALPSYFGKTALVATLVCTTLASWWASIWLSNRLAGTGGETALWLKALPVVITLPFVYDQFHLGQPNLFLLALMLTGFFLLRLGRPWWAGFPIALAASIKAFPVLVLPYLLWRRQWGTAISMVVFMLLFLVVLPGLVRGFDRNAREIGQWVHGMLLSGDDRQFSQRGDTFGWKNQSLYAVEHRLLRSIDAEAPGYRSASPIYVNLLDLKQRTVDAVFVATSIVIGLLFMFTIPPKGRPSASSEGAEIAIVLLLVVIASPVARSYYFVWLLLPYTVLCHRIATEPNCRRAIAIAIALGVSVLLLAVGINVIQPRYPQAAGNFLWATMVVILTLTACMRSAALPQPVTAGIAHGDVSRAEM
jgi:hypothetical protein